MANRRQKEQGLKRLFLGSGAIFFAFALLVGLLQQSRAAEDAVPTFDIWHGTTQTFGHNGEPQTWINILGHVSDHEQLKTYALTADSCGLRYTVNGQQPPEYEGCLEFVPHTGSFIHGNDRLARPGDFNVDIRIPDVALSPLQPGANTVVITATTTSDVKIVQEVIVNYQSDNVWPLPYAVDWSQVGFIPDVVQVVDGKWSVQSDELRPVEVGYDRLVSIGDLDWTDYEVTVPVTFHGLDPDHVYDNQDGWPGPGGAPGFGVMMRWQGHNYDRYRRQPALGWDNHGALAWFRWNATADGRFRLDGNVNPSVDSDNVVMSPGDAYIFKVRALTKSDGEYYYFKYWPAAEAEPADWQLTTKGDANSKVNGSILLLAHHADVSFGDVAIQPVAEEMYTVSVVTPTNGTIQVAPDPALYPGGYPVGTTVTVTAAADDGYMFDSWGDDLVGSPNPTTFNINQDMVVSATFVEEVVPHYDVTTSVTGNGVVTVSPDPAQYPDGYPEGTSVTVTAVADDGWSFDAWSGDLAGSPNPTTFNISSDVNATANFVQLPPDEEEFFIFLPMITRE